MIIHVSAVKVVGPHSLELAFDNGVRKRVNLRRELYGPIFEPLRDPAYFAQVASNWLGLPALHRPQRRLSA